MNTARTAPVLRLGGWGGVLILAAVFAATLIAGAAVAAPKFPPLTGRVVDNAQILSPQAEAQLTADLADLEARTGRQVVVATVPDLQGYEIEDFGYQLGRTWQIGSKDKDDGVVFLIAPKDRKVRIEVGYGLEPVLTDALSSVILQQRVLPAFREGRMEAGVVDGTEAIIEQLALPDAEAKARVAQAAARSTRDREGGVFPTLFVIFLVIWILSGVLGGFGRRGRRGGIPWWVWPLIMSGGGGGGRRGGGSFGGGDFSGGGGSFGGGGSSGRW